MVDHLISDAWSMRIIRREFAEIYSRLSGGGRKPLEDPGISGPEYAVLQNEMIANGDFRPALDYWREQWAKCSADRLGFGDLPFALSNPETPTYAFGCENSCFDPDISGEIRAFARKTKVTLYMLFLAACGQLLRRYTGRDRLAIWGHFANRMRPEVQQTVGWLANTHLIGLDMTDNLSLPEFLLRIRRTVLDASEHQEMPVAAVWRAMGSYPRHPDARILLDVSIAGEPLVQTTCNGVLMVSQATDWTPLFGRFSNLGLYIRDDQVRIHLSVQYSQDWFPSAAMQQLIGDFRDEVAGILAQKSA
jgi:hypothetical protein